MATSNPSIRKVKMENESRKNDEARIQKALDWMNKHLDGQHGIAIPCKLRPGDDGRPIYLGSFVNAEIKGLGMNAQFSRELIVWAPQMGWRSIMGKEEKDGSRSFEFECNEIYVGEGRNMKRFEEILSRAWEEP